MMVYKENFIISFGSIYIVNPSHNLNMLNVLLLYCVNLLLLLIEPLSFDLTF